MTTDPLFKKYLEYPVEEYQHRIERTRALMRERQMEALFLTQIESVFYYTGFRTWLLISKHRPIVTILPLNGTPALVIPRQEAKDALAFSWIEETRHWADGEDNIGLWVDALKDLGVANATIGMELGEDTNMAMPVLQYERLRTLLPKAEIVDCSDLLWDIRAVKSEREIDRLRTASVATGKAMSRAWDSLKAGMTERDLARSLGMAMMDEGLDFPHFMAIVSGEDFYHRLSDKFATDRVFKKGDRIRFDVGGQFHGYCTDMIRMASIGEPSELRRSLHQVAMELNWACTDALRPGLPIPEVATARRKYFDTLSPKLRARFNGRLDYGIGHSIGMTVHELPRIAPAGKWVKGDLQAGMVLCIEPSILATEGPEESFQVENLVLVTETGHERLSPLSDEWRVIEW